MTTPPDLTFIDPHRREIVEKRLDAVNEFLADPGTKNAERLAKRVGLRPASFYHLVRAWKESHDPAKLQGIGHSPRPSALTTAQQAIIKQAQDVQKSATVSAAVDEAIALADEAGIEMPIMSTIRSEVDRLRTGKVSNLPAGVTHVVDHVDLNVPIDIGGDRPVKGVLTAIITIDNPTIIGAALHGGRPDAAQVTRAIQNAETLGWPPPKGTCLLLDRTNSKAWRIVERGLGKAGVDIVGEILSPDALNGDAGIVRKRGNGRTALKLLGRYVAGYKISIRNGKRKFAVIKKGAKAMNMDDAEKLILARLGLKG